MSESKHFFNVVSEGQTYLNLIYLFLCFPLGIAYFIFLIVGISLGFGLLIIWVGLPILLLTLAGWWGLVLFERGLAESFLGVKIPYPYKPHVSGDSWWQRLKDHLANPVTWKGLFYLLAKFPFGILTFVIAVTLIATTIGFIAMPFTYEFPGYHFDIGMYYVDSFGEAILVALAGILLGFITLHVLNFIAKAWGIFTRFMLSPDEL